MQRNLLRFFFVAALPACAVSTVDDTECVGDKCDGAGSGTCPDKRYGNGVCDPTLSCAVPDIDCFQTFASDEEAATWFAELEAQLAMEEGTAPRRLLTSHPEFARVRALLDRGWEAFRENRPVGLLATARPALVFVEDPMINAFVAPTLDLKKAGLAVIVHTGLLATNGSEDAMLGLMMHELQHAVGLHVLPEIKEKVKTFYLAPDGSEPIGRTQADDARVRAAATAWLSAAGEVGYQTNPELGGMPLDGDLFRILSMVLQSGLQSNPAACGPNVQTINQLVADVRAQTDRLSGAVALDASFATRVDTALAQLQTQCLAAFTRGYVDVVAYITGTTPEQVETTLSDEDKQLVLGKHIVEALRLLAEDRRAKMRAIEAAFARDLDRPWSALRYFSTEEDADDVSVPVLRNAGLSPTGLGDFLGMILDPNTLAACRAMIDGGKVPPYGVELSDDHHATCWRIYHVGAYAQETAKRHRAEAPRVLVDAPAPKRMLPPRLRDVIMY